MAIVVQYRVKSDRAAENEELIASVFEQLEREKPEGIRYVSFKAADGVSFTHIAIVDTAEVGVASSPLIDRGRQEPARRARGVQALRQHDPRALRGTSRDDGAPRGRFL